MLPLLFMKPEFALYRGHTLRKFTGCGTSTAIERSPFDQEVKGSLLAGFWL